MSRPRCANVSRSCSGLPHPVGRDACQGSTATCSTNCFRLGHDVPAHSCVFPLDQAGGAYALVEGERLVREGLAERVVVAGVDSFLSEPTLEAYIERRRLMTPDNSNGFFPGEAGCAVLVGAAGARGAGGLNIVGLGLSHEEAHIEGTEPFRAVGMTEAVRHALDAAGIALEGRGLADH